MTLYHECPFCHNENRVDVGDEIWVEANYNGEFTETTVHLDYTCPSCKVNINQTR